MDRLVIRCGLLLLTFASTTTLAAVGRTTGFADVSPHGSARYSIPLWAPKGVGALTPRLSLVYDHRAPNGLVGVGWAIGGLSSISRCERNISQDGTRLPVQLLDPAHSDRFCLDGNRLRLTTGTYGVGGSAYRTEIDTFARISAMGSLGTGPAWFRVEGKDGLKYEYGNSTASRAIPSGYVEPQTWALSKISDRSGNYLTISYTLENGSIRPDEIAYTGRDSIGAGPYTVKFVYEGSLRPDPLQSFAGSASGASGLVLLDKRLARIEMRQNGVAVRQYGLTYELGVGGLSRLKTVTECAASLSDCLTPTTLDWHAGVSGFTGTQVSGSTYPLTSAFLYTVDHNGDGREDLLWYTSGSWKFALGQANGLLGPVTNGPTVARQWSMPIEWDGDGRTDLLYAASNVFWVARSNGNGFDAAIPTGIPFSTADDYWAADLDGDGLDDFVRVSKALPPTGGAIYARLRRATGFGAEGFGYGAPFDWFFGGFGEADGYSTTHVRRPDFNGDGRMDLLAKGCRQYEVEFGTCIGETGWFVFYSNVPATATVVSAGQIQIGQHLPNSGALNAIRPVLGDFNTDGKTDLIYADGQNWYLSESRGGAQFSSLGPSSVGFSTFTARVADYDGDGYSDLIVYNGANSRVEVMRSNGQQLQGPVPAGLAGGSSPLAVLDIAGDGLADFYSSTGGTGYIAWNHSVGPSGSFPNLLKRATDGFGVYADFTYRPMTDPSAYTKGSGAIYPAVDYVDARPIVSQLTLTDGSGNGATYNVSYTYESARLDRAGRDFLGFGKVVSVDGSAGYNQRTENVFRLDFPYTGVLASSALSQSSGTLIREVTNTWQTVTAGADDTKRDFPYASNSTVKLYEVGGIYNGSHYTTVATTVSAIDAFGTVSDSTTTTTEVATGVTVGSYKTQRVHHSSLLNDETNWCLGRPEITQLINYHTLTSGTSSTRTIQQSWDPLKCHLTQQDAELGDPDAHFRLAFAHEDDFGNITKVTVSGAHMSPRETHFDWGTRGQFPETITNALSQPTTFGYRYDLGLPTTVSDPNGITTTLGYDSFGRRNLQDRPDNTSTVWSIAACGSCSDTRARYKVTETVRDSADAPLQTNEHYFDQFDRSLHRLEQQLYGALAVHGNVQFDARGRPDRMYVPYWNGLAHNGYQQATYDQLNRVVTAALYTGSGVLERSSSIVYNGLSLTTTDPLSNATTRVVNAWGELARVTDATASNTNYLYDAFGHLKEVHDAYGNLTTEIDYNARGMKVSQTDRYLGNWFFTPNAVGEVIEQTDANGKTTDVTYDALGRMTSMTYPEGSGSITSEFVWGDQPSAHNIGQLRYQRIFGTGLSTYREDYTYDSRGRLSRTEYQEGSSTFAVDLAFDPVSGLLDTLTYPTSTPGNRLKLKYDYQFGHVLRVKDFNPPATIFWQANIGDAEGRVLDESLGNGIQTVRSFDPLTGLVEHIQSGPGGTATVQNLAYEWNTTGNMTRREDLNDNLVERFYYDALHRLDYSTLNNVTNLDVAYDALGNITERISAATSSYSVGHTISWYANNRPKTISGNFGSSTFFYTPSGARLRQNAVYGSTTENTISIGGFFDQVTRGSVIEYRHIIPTGSDVSVVYTRRGDDSVSTYYATKDHLGSGSAITASNGAVLVRESFGAFGERRGTNWQGNPSSGDWTQITASTRRGFTGHEHLDNLALIHMNGRVYDAYVGRFVSPDPFVQAPDNGQSFNRYAYAFNNPLTFVDPSGFASGGTDESWDGPEKPPRGRFESGYYWTWADDHPTNIRQPPPPHLPDPPRWQTPVALGGLSQPPNTFRGNDFYDGLTLLTHGYFERPGSAVLPDGSVLLNVAPERFSAVTNPEAARKYARAYELLEGASIVAFSLLGPYNIALNGSIRGAATIGAVRAAAPTFARDVDDLASFGASVPAQSGGFLNVVSHADAQSAYVLSGGQWIQLSHRSLARYIAGSAEYSGQPVRLIACNAGACSAGLAQNLANKLGVPVLAPTDLAYISSTGGFWSSGWRLFEPGVR